MGITRRIRVYNRVISDEEHAQYIKDNPGTPSAAPGHNGFRMLYATSKRDPEWDAVLDALADYGTIDRRDAETAKRFQKIKNFRCPNPLCGGSSGYGWRDGTPGARHPGLLLTCSHRCSTRVNLEAIGIPTPDIDERYYRVEEVDTETISPSYDESEILDDAEFWPARPELLHIHDFAVGRLVAPWAMLGACLVRTACCVPPWVQLPPIIGGPASLNMYLTVVAGSGGGKDVVLNASEDALDITGGVGYDTAPLGSGEGVTHTYVQRGKDEDGQAATVFKTQSALFTAVESEALAAITARQGATLMPVIRNAFNGGQLGFSYVDKDKGLKVPKHKYRFGLIILAQPENTAFLINDHIGGTPQRFLWLSALDPHAPDSAPTAPDPYPVKIPMTRERTYLPVWDAARELIVQTRIASLRGEQNGHALDGHALLVRLKVAAVLGVLDGRLEVSESDWKLAATIMHKSDRMRDQIMGHLARSEKERNRARAVSEAERIITVNGQVHGHDVARVANVVMRRMKDSTLPVAHSELRGSLHSRDRKFFGDAVEQLVDKAQVKVLTTAQGVSYDLV